MSWMQGKNGLAIARLWWEVSAKDEPVGRLASRIACVLQGKHKPVRTSHHDYGDYVVVTDIEEIKFGGRKDKYREYRGHTGRRGAGMTKVPVRDMRAHKPDTLLRHAVSGMLPPNSYRWPRLQRLRTFIGTDHPYKRNLIQRYDYGAPALPPQLHYEPPKSLVQEDWAQREYGVERITVKSSTGSPATSKPYGRPNWYNSRLSKLKTTNQLKKTRDQRRQTRSK